MLVRALMKNNKELIYKNFEEKRSEVSFFPDSFDIEVTSFCNYECIMCPHTLLKNKIAKHLNINVLERLLPYLDYCTKVSLQGDGEPFLNPQIEEIIKFFQARNIKLLTTTNLSVFNERLARLINEAFDTVTISCDASKKELYEAIRKKGDFDNFRKNLSLIAKYVVNPKVIMNCVVMRQNLSGLADLVRFAAEYGIKHLVFSEILTDADLQNEADSPANYPIMTDFYVSEAVSVAEKLNVDLQVLWDYQLFREYSEEDLQSEKERAKSLASCNALSSEQQERFIRRYLDLKNRPDYKPYQSGKYHCDGICPNLYRKSYIDVSGNVTLCCYGKINAVGNILEKDFGEIWNGNEYVSCRCEFFEHRLPNFCVGCKYAVAAQTFKDPQFDFHITDFDEAFMHDLSFWNNRTNR